MITLMGRSVFSLSPSSPVFSESMAANVKGSSRSENGRHLCTLLSFLLSWEREQLVLYLLPQCQQYVSVCHSNNLFLE